MIGGLLSELAKALASHGEHRFGGTMLSDVAKGLLDSPRQAKVSGDAKGLVENRPHGGGTGSALFNEKQAVELHIPAPAHSRDPVPILKQILRILHTLAMKAGIVPKPAPGTPPPMPLSVQARQLGQTIGQRVGLFRAAEENQPQTSKYHLKQIGGLLAKRRGIEFKEAPKAAGEAAGGLAGIGRAAMMLGRMAGVAGLVIGALGLLYGAAKDFVSGVVEQNRELAKYNAAIASSFSKLEVTRMRLEVQQGAATQGTATMLNDQLESLLTEIQPIRQGVGNLVNSVSAVVVLMARVYVVVSKIPGIINVFFPKLGLMLDIAGLAQKELEKLNQKPAGAPLNILQDLQKQGQAAALQPLPGQGKKPQFIQPLPARPRKRP